MATRDQARPSQQRARTQDDLSIVTARQLRHVGFSDHAIERFAERAGLARRDRAHVEPVIRDLLAQEGLISREPPAWARSDDPGEMYLQIGQWMAFILRPDHRVSGRGIAVTAVNGPRENDWETALRRGYLNTPPAPRLAPVPGGRVRLCDTIAAVLGERRAGQRERALVRLIARTQLERRRVVRAARADVVAVNRGKLDAHEEARDRAHRMHVERYA